MRPHVARRTRLAALSLALSVVAGAGCERSQATPPPRTASAAPSARAKAPDFDVFAPLQQVMVTPPSVPFLLTAFGEIGDSPCVAPIEVLSDDDAGATIDALALDHERAITESLRGWIAEKVAPAVPDRVVDTWKIVPVEILVRDMGDAQLRFVESPECIDPSTGEIAGESRLVVALFGSRTFQFSTDRPMKRSAADRLVKQLEEAGLGFETEDLVDYELVTDSEGAPVKGPGGEKQYRSPTLGVVSESEITLPAKQTLGSWTVTTEEPVYFAFREADSGELQREFRDGHCDVNLVWGDPTFREPGCPEHPGVAFAAAEKGGQVEIRIKRGDAEDVASELVSYDEVKMVRIDDQSIIWISPSKIEEGALVKLNSVVLSPGP